MWKEKNGIEKDKIERKEKKRKNVWIRLLLLKSLITLQIGVGR